MLVMGLIIIPTLILIQHQHRYRYTANETDAEHDAHSAAKLILRLLLPPFHAAPCRCARVSTAQNTRLRSTERSHCTIPLHNTQAPCHARHGAACVLATVSTAALCCLPRQPLGATASRLEQPHPHAALRQDNTAVTTEAPIGAPDQVNNTFAQVPAHESTKIKI